MHWQVLDVAVPRVIAALYTTSPLKGSNLQGQVQVAGLDLLLLQLSEKEWLALVPWGGTGAKAILVCSGLSAGMLPTLLVEDEQQRWTKQQPSLLS
jgi:hypothetical protein